MNRLGNTYFSNDFLFHYKSLFLLLKSNNK